MSANIIDSFFVALGFEVDPKGLQALERQADAAKEKILSIGTALTALVTGLVVKQVADIGSAFEQNKIQIAGFFAALGQSTDFQTALGDADQTLEMIAAAAAKLPGEAEEYQEVFRDTFSFVKTAVGGSLKEMTDFTNQLTAIGKAGQLPAAQIAREASEMLADKSHVTIVNRLWVQLLPLMKRVAGQAHLTKEEFNKMSAPKRAELMKKAFAGLQPMLDASANSFDAMWGAAVSGAKKLVRLGSAGMFEGMKKALGGLNALFFDTNFQLTELGKTTVAVISRIGRAISTLITDLIQVGGWFLRTKAGALALKVTLGFLAAQLAVVGFEKVAGGVMTLVKAIFNLRRALTGGLLIAIGLIAEDLYQFYTGGKSVTGLLVEKFGPAVEYITDVVLAGLIAMLLRTQVAWIATWLVGLGPIGLIIGAVALLAFGIYELVKHWKAVVAYFGVAGTFVAQIISSSWDAASRIVVSAIGMVRVAWASMAKSVAALWTGMLKPALEAGLKVLMKAWDVIGQPAVMLAIKVALVALALAAGAVLVSIALILATLGLAAAAVVGAIDTVVTAVSALGQVWDTVVGGMKDSWNSFAETINGLGVITLPTFDVPPPMLPAGQGVLLPPAGPEGPDQQAYEQSYLTGAPPAPRAPTPSAALSGLADKIGLGVQSAIPAYARGAAGAAFRGGPAAAAQPTPSTSFSGAPSYLPAAPAPGGAAGNTTSVHVDQVTIKTDDPQKMGRDFNREVIRAGQSKVGL